MQPTELLSLSLYYLCRHSHRQNLILSVAHWRCCRHLIFAIAVVVEWSGGVEGVAGNGVVVVDGHRRGARCFVSFVVKIVGGKGYAIAGRQKISCGVQYATRSRTR